MRQATPEQIRQVQHRRKIAPTICKVYGVMLFGSFVMLSQHGVPFVLRVAGIGIVYGTVPFALFIIFWYWRCPVCKSGFSRQSGGKCCEKCGTRFEV